MRERCGTPRRQVPGDGAGTTGAAILGLLPMLFGIAGSELERPLAIVMVGGLVTSTLFTLLALPSFCAWVGRPAGERT